VSLAVPTLAGPTRGRGHPIPARWRRRLRENLPAIGVFVGAIGVWEVGLALLGDNAFVLPRPTAIAAALGENWDADRWPLFRAARSTLFEALGGLAIGIVAGVAAAFVTARWAGAREIVLPLAIGANAVPVIAFAPLMNNWFGVLSPVSKMAIVAVLVFFPIFINVVRGLVQVEAAAIELMRSYAASEWTILRRLRIPNALPYFFTALKISATLSLIGAIVGEYFGGANDVLGRVIVQSASALRFDVTWAAILLAAATGIVFYLAIVAIERLVIPWHASMRSTEGT
jgi:NitT/TauT family transport system permease protein